VVELAVHATVPQLSRAVSKYPFDEERARSEDLVEESPSEDDPPSEETPPPPVADLPDSDEGRAAEPATVTMYEDRGRFHLHYEGPADAGAQLEAAIREAKDALFQEGNAAATLADGLAEVARRSLGSVESVHRRDAFRVYVHLDSEGGWLTGKPRLPHHVTDKLTCDGVLQPVWHTEGKPVNVGRSQRIVPDRTRRLIEDRDRGCRFPGCTARGYLEVHHVRHWKDGGRTDTRELVCLCPFHHDRHHAGDFSVEGDADDRDGLTITNRFGRVIDPGPRYGPPAEPATSASYAGPTGEPLQTKWVVFDHRPPPVPA
jgi:hypothetical protein